MINSILFILLSVSFFFCSGYADEQDMPSTTYANPLKGFTTFTFMPAYGEAKGTNEKIKRLIEDQLKKYGSVNKVDMLTRNKKGEQAIDVSMFSKGTALNYQIKNVISVEGKVLPFVRATLSARSAVTIEKTNMDYSTYIWCRDCFLAGSVDNDLEQLIEQTLDILLATFASDYAAVNKEKPTFYLVFP